MTSINEHPDQIAWRERQRLYEKAKQQQPQTVEEFANAIADYCIGLIRAERRATVDRIRQQINPDTFNTGTRYILSILDEEAARV